MEHKKLGDIATYINGYAFKPQDRGEKGLPIIRIQDLTGNAYDVGFYDGDYPERIEINDGDILILRLCLIKLRLINDILFLRSSIN